MLLRRRSLLALAGVAAAAPALAATPPSAPAAGTEGSGPFSLAARAIGKKDAPVRVAEFFSLTCPHCARFAAETFPQVKSQLVDTGKLYYGFADFPLDQVALTAAMVARALPPDRYEPFILALLATQDRWAFARGVNSTAELAKMATLAGMPHATFEAAINDKKMRDAILHEQQVAETKYGVDSTPTFFFSGAGAQDVKQAGEMSYADFDTLVKRAGG